MAIAAPLKDLLEQLLDAGKNPDKDLLQAIESHGQAAVPHLIAIVTDRDLIWAESDAPEVWAPTHAMRLLGRTQAAEAVPPLLALLEEEQEAEWIREELPEVMAQVGPAAIEPLKAYATDRDHNLYGRSAACNSLVKIAQAHPETRQGTVGFLRTHLRAYPDERPDDETFRAFVISDLLDLKAKEAYPDIEAAYLEDRVDEMVVALDDVQRELRIRDGVKPRQRADFELRLECQACGFTRPHAVDLVYFDLGTHDRKERGEDVPYSEYIIPQRITCPRCGAVDRYQPTGETYLAITAEMLKLAAQGRSTPGLVDGAEHLRLMRFAVAGGQEMHPFEALDMYQRRLEKKPGDARLRLRYGNVLRFLGRWDEAQAQYERVQALEPRNDDVFFALAQMAELQGDAAGALARYEEYLSRLPQRPAGREAREMWDHAQDMAKRLRRQEAGLLGRLGRTARTIGQAGLAGARFLGLTLDPDMPALPPEPEAPPRSRPRRQEKKVARKAAQQTRKAQRRPKKRKRKRKKK